MAPYFFRPTFALCLAKTAQLVNIAFSLQAFWVKTLLTSLLFSFSVIVLPELLLQIRHVSSTRLPPISGRGLFFFFFLRARWSCYLGPLAFKIVPPPMLRSTLISLDCMLTSKGALYSQGCGFLQLHDLVSLFKSSSFNNNETFFVDTSSLYPPKLRVSLGLATPMVPSTWPRVALKDTQGELRV